MQNPILSIIVPIYNVEKYLKKCIESILSQTFKEYELILVNDGSPDSCLSICKEYEKKDDRIIVVDKENGGLSSARNAGINIAKGKYLGFVDSDDWIEKSMYESLITIAEKYDADIVHCEYVESIDENKKILQDKNIIEKCFNRDEALDNLYNELTVSTAIAWNKIYKRKLFDEIRYPNGKIHEDEFTTYKLIYKSNKIVYTNKKLYYYRNTPNSIMNSSFNLKKLDYFEALEERIGFFNKVNNNKMKAKTIIHYYFRLIESYYSDKDINDKEKMEAIICEKLKSGYKMLIKNKDVKLKNKIRGTLFKISPVFYKKIFV